MWYCGWTPYSPSLGSLHTPSLLMFCTYGQKLQLASKVHCPCSTKTPQFGQSVVSGQANVAMVCQWPAGERAAQISGLGAMKVKDGLDICWVLLDRSCGLAGWQVYRKGCRVAHHKHGACQPLSHHFMGKHQGMLEIEERSPDTTQVCYESGLKPSK